MANSLCLNENFSTARLLIAEKPEILKNPNDQFNTVFFLPEGENRRSEGGLRTKGYFKQSYPDKPLISIITIVYNSEKYLEGTIQSILNQTYDNIEYIIIDGGSTDGTFDIIQNYHDTIDYWISEKDNGIYDAMNKGLRACTGDYVWFINAGDRIFEADTTQKMINMCCDTDVFYGDNQLINLNGDNIKVAKSPAKVTWKSFLHGMVVSHQAIVIRRNLVNLYDLQYKYVSDQDWVITALQKTDKICNIQAPLSRYLLGGFSDQNFLGCWHDKFEIVKKHYGFFGYLLNLWYYIIARAKLKVKRMLNKEIK